MGKRMIPTMDGKISDTKAEVPTGSNAPKPGGQPLGKPAAWPREFGGPKGPEPTRYGDWERNGRVSDF